MNALVASKKYPGRLPKSLVELEANSLTRYITSDAAYFYKDTPKPLQVEAVSALVQGKNVFVRAGTGFGKTRISEMFFNLFKTKVIILVLNPLDSLGDDQVIH
jgi:superfamily II DNA or RNA helicase